MHRSILDNETGGTLSFTANNLTYDCFVLGLWDNKDIIKYEIVVKDIRSKEVWNIEVPKKIHDVIKKIYLNGEYTTFVGIDSDDVVVLKRNKDDKFDLSYALMFAFMTLSVGCSKTKMSKCLDKFRDINVKA